MLKISILLCSILVLLITYLIYVVNKLIHPKRKSLYEIDRSLFKYMENVSFKDSENILTLRGYYFSKNENTKTIIFSHGYKSTRMQFREDTNSFVKSMLENNINILIYDFRNCGLSDGNITTLGYKEKFDLLGAVNFIYNEKQQRNIILYGCSMGGAVSIISAAEDKRISAVIADSSFSNLEIYLKSNLHIWSKLPKLFTPILLLIINIISKNNLYSISPIDSIKKLSNFPILLIHSKADEKTSIEHSEKLFKANQINNTKIKFWKGKFSNHCCMYIDNKDKYINKLINFIEDS